MRPVPFLFHTYDVVDRGTRTCDDALRSFTTNGGVMELRGVHFGPVLDASGVRGFFGEGYWHHRYCKPFGLRFDGATFVAKTTTLLPRAGNMPLQSNGVTPIDR